jgi:hypothetical protein
MFTISVGVTGGPTSPDGLQRLVYVWLNTDKNDSTGSPTGNEYLLVFVDEPADQPPWWNIYRWNGRVWDSVPESPTMRFVRQSAMNWTINKSDIGGASGFAVYVSTLTEDADDNVLAREFAPDAGRWVFDVSGPSKIVTTFVTPLVGKPVTLPAKIRAGHRLTVSFPVSRADAGDKPAPLTSGTIVGVPTIAGGVVRHSESFSSGTARLSFVVPKTAKGKQLRVKLTVKAPSSRGPDGIAVDLATGYIGIIATRSIGQSTTRVATFMVR